MFCVKSIFAGVCGVCNKEHPKWYICLPMTHTYFINKEENPLITECYVYHIRRFFKLNHVDSLDKCKLVSKIFREYYILRMGDIQQIDLMNRTYFEVKLFSFFNKFVKTESEINLFHATIWFYSKEITESYES